MGNLAKYLQIALMARCPEGWRCRPEYKVFSPELERLLGFPRGRMFCCYMNRLADVFGSSLKSAVQIRWRITQSLLPDTFFSRSGQT